MTCISYIFNTRDHLSNNRYRIQLPLRKYQGWWKMKQRVHFDILWRSLWNYWKVLNTLFYKTKLISTIICHICLRTKRSLLNCLINIFLVWSISIVSFLILHIFVPSKSILPSYVSGIFIRSEAFWWSWANLSRLVSQLKSILFCHVS